MLTFGQTSIFEWLILIWAIFSVILYILLVLMIYRKRYQNPFHNTFFKLYISVGIADICALLTHYPLRVFRYWGWITFEYFFEHKNETLLQFFVLFLDSLPYFFGLNQYVGVTLLALNRYRSVVNPLELWSDKVLKLCYFLQWGTGLAFVVPKPFLSLRHEIIMNKSSKIFVIVMENVQYETIYFVMVLLVSWSLIFINSGLYIAIYRTIRRKSQESESNDDQQARKSAIRLAFMCSILFILMFGLNVLVVILAIMIDVGIDTSEMILLWTQWTVIFDMINPWLLLICSDPVREEFIKFISVKMTITTNAVAPGVAMSQKPTVTRFRNSPMVL